jgi:hypothetical protein
LSARFPSRLLPAALAFTALLATLTVAVAPVRADDQTAIVTKAAQEVGTLEGSTRANSYGSAVGRSDSTTRYAWCATFVSWVMQQTGVTTFRSAAVGDWVDAARGGRYGLSVVTTPVPGDLVAFDWDGNGDYAYPNRHIGIVEKAPTSTGSFGTIEGNTTKPGDGSVQGVFRKTRSTKATATTLFIRVNAASTVPPVQSDPAAPAGWYRQDLGTPVDVGTTVASQEPGSLDVFYLRGGVLQQRYYRPGSGRWTAAPSLGRPSGRTLTGRVTALSQAKGSLDVFARADDGGLWQKYFRNGTWGAWVKPSVGGTIGSNPVAVSMAPGRVDVFAVKSGKVVQAYYTGGHWYPLRTLSIALPSGVSATFEGAPAAASGADRRIDLVARDTAGRVWSSYFGGSSFSQWKHLTGTTSLRATRSDSLGASSWGPGRVDVFVAMNSGYTWHTWRATETGGFQPWQNMATRGKGPAAVSWDVGRVDTFYRDSDGTLGHDWFARY